MNNAQVNPDFDEVKRWKKALLESFMNYSG